MTHTYQAETGDRDQPGPAPDGRSPAIEVEKGLREADDEIGSAQRNESLDAGDLVAAIARLEASDPADAPSIADEIASALADRIEQPVPERPA